MDDEYVSIFLWNDDVGMLPETKAKDSVAAGIVPIVGRIVKGIVTPLAYQDRCSFRRGLASNQRSHADWRR